MQRPDLETAVFERLLLGCLLLSAVPAWAQDTPDDEEVEAPVDLGIETVLGNHPQAVQDAAIAWESAWRHTPRLVSLKDTEEPADVEELTELRLKLLGEKTFSNREWRTYWEQQGVAATALADALQAANGPADSIDTMRKWTELAANKVTNQDAFFKAIETEKDALEDRLESTLAIGVSGEDQASDEPLIEDPNPYEKRSQRMEDLDGQIASQQTRRLIVESEIEYVKRLLETEKILSEALATDLVLATTELGIAQGAAGDDSAWQQLWQEIAKRTEIKVDAIAGEVSYGQTRSRSREVELGLAESQIAFRDDRLTRLKADYEHVANWTSFADATWQTLLLWLQNSLWKIVLGLLAVYIGVRVSLRVLDRAKVIILERTDDNPDDDDDGDQRRQTLADVFASVAKISVYIIGGLVALEQIGINTGPLLGSVAILGLAVSFGSQNLVRDVVNGFFILLENQFAVGDVVTINGKTGGIERITIRSTWMRAGTGDLHVIPNGSITLVSNLTRGWSRSMVHVGVGYGSDLAQVEQVMNEVGATIFAEEEWAEIMEEAPAFVGVTELGDSAVTIRMQVKVDAGSQWGVTRELTRRLKEAFDEAGIDIPYPQMVTHVGKPAV
jgi:moderate conductance mechanosensitive channel